MKVLEGYGNLPDITSRLASRVSLLDSSGSSLSSGANTTSTSTSSLLSSLNIGLNPNRYSLNVDLSPLQVNWNSLLSGISNPSLTSGISNPSLTSGISNQTLAPQTTTLNPQSSSGGFVSGVKSFITQTLLPTVGQLAPAILQYKLAKYQLKKQAELAKLQQQVAYSQQYPIPTGGGYPQGQPTQAPYPQTPYEQSSLYYNPQQPQNDTSKYLLLGGLGIGALLLVMLMRRD